MKTVVVWVFVSLTLTMASLANAAEADSCGQLYTDYIEYKKKQEGIRSESNYLPWYYLGYISGFMDGSMLATIGPDYPGRSTAKQVGMIIGKWLANHPERWHEHRLVCAYDAVIEAFGRKQ